MDLEQQHVSEIQRLRSEQERADTYSRAKAQDNAQLQQQVQYSKLDLEEARRRSTDLEQQHISEIQRLRSEQERARRLAVANEAELLQRVDRLKERLSLYT